MKVRFSEETDKLAKQAQSGDESALKRIMDLKAREGVPKLKTFLETVDKGEVQDYLEIMLSPEQLARYQYSTTSGMPPEFFPPIKEIPVYFEFYMDGQGFTLDDIGAFNYVGESGAREYLEKYFQYYEDAEDPEFFDDLISTAEYALEQEYDMFLEDIGAIYVKLTDIETENNYQEAINLLEDIRDEWEDSPLESYFPYNEMAAPFSE